MNKCKLYKRGYKRKGSTLTRFSIFIEAGDNQLRVLSHPLYTLSYFLHLKLNSTFDISFLPFYGQGRCKLFTGRNVYAY